MTDRDDKIVAIGLLTASDLRVLGAGFKRLYPITSTTEFDELLTAIDRADSDTRRQPDC